jgi:hypothetical protein
LDAILIVIRLLENPSQPHFREALEFSVAQIVRGNGSRAKIEFEYVRSEDEARAINEVFAALDSVPPFQFNRDEPPISMPAVVSWVYPKKDNFYGSRNFSVESANSLPESKIYFGWLGVQNLFWIAPTHVLLITPLVNIKC